jgi:hypothetical protein
MFPDLTRDDVFRLETRRLWLRWPRLADAQAIVRLAGEKSVAEMTAVIPHPYPPQAAERFVFEARKANAGGEGLQMAITPKGKPNALIGVVGIGPSRDDGRAHLGYWIGTPSWDRATRRKPRGHSSMPSSPTRRRRSSRPRRGSSTRRLAASLRSAASPTRAPGFCRFRLVAACSRSSISGSTGACGRA